MSDDVHGRPLELFRALQRGAPFQPATNLWRAVELDEVVRHGLPAGRGLDLGCGDGRLTAIIDRATSCARSSTPGAAPRQWVGIDLDPLETQEARASGLYAAVHTGSAEHVPEPDASMDFVFSNSVLEHIPPIEGVLAEAARVLRAGGRFIATVPGPGFHAALQGGFPYGGLARAEYLAHIDRRCAHLRYWDTATWRRALTACGLELRTATGYLSPAQVRRWERLSNATGGLLVRLAGGQQRPIELQRRLRLRGEPSALSRAAGAAAAALAPLLASGCPLHAQALPEEQAGCLLIDAVKA